MVMASRNENAGRLQACCQVSGTSFQVFPGVDGVHDNVIIAPALPEMGSSDQCPRLRCGSPTGTRSKNSGDPTSQRISLQPGDRRTVGMALGQARGTRGKPGDSTRRPSI